MPDTLRYLILGLVQGVTEVLPISSDGHLVILSRWLSAPGDGLTLVVLLHLGSLAALILAFRRPLAGLVRAALGGDPAERVEGQGGRRLLGLIALATLPAVIIGPLIHSFFQEAFQSSLLAGAMLVLTGVILLTTRVFPDGKTTPDARAALVMGIAQAFALLPGLSRSALTLAAGFALGADRKRVAHFSFLMAVPAIGAANVLELTRAEGLRQIDPAGLVVGILAAFVASLLAIRAVLSLIKRGRFEWFGVYCLVVGLIVLSIS
jgi:undecaprenyl-diphosphatase